MSYRTSVFPACMVVIGPRRTVKMTSAGAILGLGSRIGMDPWKESMQGNNEWRVLPAIYGT